MALRAIKKSMTMQLLIIPIVITNQREILILFLLCPAYPQSPLAFALHQVSFICLRTTILSAYNLFLVD